MHGMDLNLPLSAIMTTDLIILRPGDPLKAASDAFRKNNIHHLPVVDLDGILVGIFSKSDYLRLGNVWTSFQKNQDMEGSHFHAKVTIGEVMTRELVKLSPTDSISMAVGIFRENLFHSIPLVEKNTLVGLVTTFDLLKYAFQKSGLE